jgi:signal transduction histidine kinase/CheY-like chemotaxis protein
MQLPDILRRRRRDRLERFNIGLLILLAGWVPSILALIVSYTILTRTLESKILRDRQTFVELIGHLIGDDLSRTSDVIEYYQTLPDIVRMPTAPNASAVAQQWLSSAFYSQPRVDGMFVTDAEGRLIASLPVIPDMAGKDFESQFWRERAEHLHDVFVSPVHRRLADQRLATDIVGAVRDSTDKIVGYIGATVLVERMGRRLSTIEFSDQLLCEVFDQNGVALFDRDFNPNVNVASRQDGGLMSEIRKHKTGHFELLDNVYSYSPIESTGWAVVIEQPKAVAYKPVHDLLNKMNILVGWLVVGTAVGAWLVSRLYRRHTETTRRVQREIIFNENILANMPTGIAFVDPASRRFLQANGAFLEMAKRFGNFPAERNIKEAAYDEVKIAPADSVENVINIGAPFHLTEYPIKDTGGMTHFVDLHLLRLEDPEKRVQGVLYLIEDKTRDVALRQELIGANAAKDQFLALLSHELRNPLTPVIAMVAELEETMPESENVRQALEVIRRNVELEARLIDDLLDVTRIAKGKLQLSFENISIHEVLHRAYEICAEEIQDKKLATEFRLKATEMHVQGDPARLQQVFWNLIKNSVKFTPEGGRISIETSNPSPQEIEIRISDTGIGIEPEKIDKIFNAFEQGQTSITRRFGGLGLGLAISKTMVDAHGGRIRVRSDGLNNGATFSITLQTVPAPTGEERAKTESGRARPELARRGGSASASGEATASRPDQDGETDRQPASPERGRLLVVDDHKDTCLGMKMLLERRGYQITLAHTAEQAAAKANDQHFDLLISDIGLPGRSGYDLMRELHDSKGMPGIALSGYGTEHDVNEARAAGFSDHLTKPINFDRLEEAIQNILGKS